MSTTAEHFSIMTHNGRITIENTNRGTHRTFQVRTQPDDAKFAPGTRILSLLTGSDNESDYLGFAFVRDEQVILWKKYRTEQYQRLVDVLLRPEHYESLGCRYLYEGRCRRCNRTLTTPESIQSGIGPVCAEKGGL